MSLIPEKYFDVCPDCGGEMRKNATKPELHPEYGWVQEFTCQCCGEEYLAQSSKGNKDE